MANTLSGSWMARLWLKKPRHPWAFQGLYRDIAASDASEQHRHGVLMRTNHRNELGYSLGRLKIACG